jgi:ribosomal RNA assembly protein
MIDYVRIPEERIKILKNNSKLKENLEKLSEAKIELGEEVAIQVEDPIAMLRVKEVVKAFGRGFDMEDALNLLDEDYYLHIIEVSDFAGKSRNRMLTLKGRVIGSEGKTKQRIEKISETKISVYGKTVCIVGKWIDVELAAKAIEMLLSGSLHNTVYRFLEQQKR